jgi:hypothetical protein
LQNFQGTTKENFKNDEYSSTQPVQYEGIKSAEWITRLGEIKERISDAQNTLKKIGAAFEAINTASKGDWKHKKKKKLKKKLLFLLQIRSRITGHSVQSWGKRAD